MVFEFLFPFLNPQTTEPFHAALRLASPNDPSSMLVQRYFAREGMKGQFSYKQHTAYLVSISKQDSNVKVVTNCTGVIVSMINSQYGFIKFGVGEKALFSAKSLFKDGWQFSGDPLKLPAMKFDGYQLVQSDKSKEKEKHTWYAVLVWCGRRPSPQYCSSTDDLNSTPMFRESCRSQASDGGSKSRIPSQTMRVGEVVEVRRDGAVAKSREDAVSEVWLPGWRRKLANRPGTWLSTVDGECIGIRDVVAFYTSSQSRPGFSAVGRNVAVLKESGSLIAERSRRSTCCSDDLQQLARRNYNYESDSEEELSVSEGELEWLEQDLETVIAKEDPKAKTIDLLKAVQINLHEVRGKPGRKKSLKKGDKPGYKQMPSQPSDFRRMKGMMAKFEAQGYDSDSDADYHPGDEVEEVDDTDVDETTTEGGDSSFYVSGDGDGQKRKRRVKSNTETSAVSSHASKDVTTSTTLSEENSKENKKTGNLPFWVVACSLPEVYDTELGKFIPVDR